MRDEELTRFSAEERERLLRGFLAGRLLEEGLIARPDDRGDAVLHLAPPLICGRRELDELVAKTEAVLTDASERFFVRASGARRPRLLAARGGRRRAGGARRGDLDADVVIVGGGYAGMWTAWNLLERGARVVLLEAEVCGHGPAGATAASARRCGRTCRRCASGSATSARWPLRGVVGQRARDRRVVRGGGGRRLVPAGGLRRDLDERGAGRGDRRDPAAATVAPDKVIALDEAAVRARCSSPRFRRGLFVPDDATVQPARLALGLRRRLLERGVAMYEHSRVRALDAHPAGSSPDRGARVRAGAAVLTINAATRGVRPLRLAAVGHLLAHRR